MLYLDKEKKSSYSEAIRTIRTNIKYSFIDYENKIILVTSPNQGDGKSSIASNLALSLSQENKKVIIVDCDLRRPTIHSIFNISNLSGLTEYLVNEEKLEDIIHSYSEYLDIITTGHLPHNPSEILSSEKFDKLLQDFKKKYDYIILDTTPLKMVTDSLVLSAKSDGVVLVVRYRKTKKSEILEVKRKLSKVNAKLIGIVINRANNNNKYYYYY